MKAWITILLFLLISCAQKPARGPAANDTEIYLGVVDREKSVVKLFPSVNYNGQFQYYFYLQLKNNLGRYVDIESRDVELISSKNEKIDFVLKRQLRGRYYITINTSEEISQKKLSFLIGGISLKEKFQLSIAPVDKKQSKIKLLSRGDHKAKFQLLIADKKGNGIEVPNPPEVIVEPGGSGEIQDLVHKKAGVWEFTMTYPEHNIIMYINVRVHDTYLEQLFRFHHVEK